MLHFAAVLHSLTRGCALFVGGWNCLDPHQKLGKKGKNDQLSPQATKFSFNPHFATLASHTAHPLWDSACFKGKEKHTPPPQKNPEQPPQSLPRKDINPSLAVSAVCSCSEVLLA